VIVTTADIFMFSWRWCGLRLRSYENTGLRPLEMVLILVLYSMPWSCSWFCRSGLARSWGSSHYYELSVLSTIWSMTRSALLFAASLSSCAHVEFSVLKYLKIYWRVWVETWNPGLCARPPAAPLY